MGRGILGGLLLGALLVVPAAGQAEIYRWTDSQGRVHFSDSPPEKAGKGAERVQVRSEPISEDAYSDRVRLQRQKRMADRLAKERQQREARREAQAEQAARQEARCRRMRAQLKNMERISRFYRLNDKGERVFYSDQEAEAYRARRRAEYEKACG